MTVVVRYFASLRQCTGCSEETLDIDSGSDVSALWSMLEKRHPALAAIRFRPLVACDRSYSGWERSLEGVGEVAFLPPVSGG
jgi:molybdopterin converting factor subunit 1